MAKVEEVQTRKARKEHKAKDKPKRSKLKKHKTKRTGPKRKKSQPDKLPPSGHVHRAFRVREATINKSPEQSQIGRKKNHESTYEPQPSEVLHSNLVDIARYVKLARKAVGKTATKAYNKHLRSSITNGLSLALKEAQIIQTSQPEKSIKQGLRDKVLRRINDKSPYTDIRQVLITLAKFIQALQNQATPAQQSVADQMDLSPGVGQQKGPEKDQKHDFGPGQLYYSRPQDSQIQCHKNRTFGRVVILIIWRRSVLRHLSAMSKEEFLSTIDSAFQKSSPHSDPSRALMWISYATITSSGNVQVSMHTKNPKILDVLTEELITEWARILQDEAEQSSRVFEVLVPNFPANPTDLEDADHKTDIIERIFRDNTFRIPSFTRNGDICDIQTADSDEEGSRGIAIILIFNSFRLANSIIEHGLVWNGEHHRCEALGASELLDRCERCQLYTHTTNSCTNTVRCGKCAEPHFTRFCQSINFTCAVCSGPHPAYSVACPARNAVREEIHNFRFAPESDEAYPQLTKSGTHQRKPLELTGSHSHSEEVLEKIRRLRQEIIALEEGVTSGLGSRDQHSASIDVTGKKLKSRRNVSGKGQQQATVAGLPAASNGKRGSHKRKAEEYTTDDIHPEAVIDNKRVKQDDSAFNQFGYQWTPGCYGPRG